jgi:hypothetical protein
LLSFLLFLTSKDIRLERSINFVLFNSFIMHFPSVSVLPLSLILSAAIPALAQTSTSCDPTKKSCPADTALSSSTYTHDFTKGADDDNWKVTAGDISYTSKGAEFTINKAGDAPTIQSQWYIFFGSVSFIMTAAPGTGVVSSAILESDDLDEIDWEWLGGEPANVQSKLQSLSISPNTGYPCGEGEH